MSAILLEEATSVSDKDGKCNQPHQLSKNTNLKGDTIFTHQFTWQRFPSHGNVW